MKVSFKKKYSYAPYLNVDIEGESVCDETKESFFESLDTLNSWADEWYKTRYGEYDEMRGTTERIVEAAPKMESQKDIEAKADVDWKEFVKQLMKYKHRAEALEFVEKSEYKYVSEAKAMAETLPY